MFGSLYDVTHGGTQSMADRDAELLPKTLKHCTPRLFRLRSHQGFSLLTANQEVMRHPRVVVMASRTSKTVCRSFPLSSWRSA